MGQTDKHSTPEATPGASAVTDQHPDEIIAPQEAPDTPGKNENGDGLTGGQTTAETFGDELGILNGFGRYFPSHA